MKTLSSKTAIITGGAMGIGFATATRLAREGCTVTLWDVNEEALGRAVSQLCASGATAFGHRCDVTDTATVGQLTRTAVDEMGRIDILVNNAGYVKGGDLVDQPDEVWERTIAVNLNAVVAVTRAVLPFMEEHNEGHVVNISSAAGMVGVGGLAVYCATKWGVWGFTESMRMESYKRGKRGIRWSSIHPSYLAEGMFAGAKLGLLGNLLLPLVKDHDVIAKAIVEGALKRNRLSPKRPYTVHLTPRLRGLLPDRWFQQLLIMLGIPHSMDHWKGRRVESE